MIGSVGTVHVKTYWRDAVAVSSIAVNSNRSVSTASTNDKCFFGMKNRCTHVQAQITGVRGHPWDVSRRSKRDERMVVIRSQDIHPCTRRTLLFGTGKKAFDAQTQVLDIPIKTKNEPSAANAKFAAHLRNHEVWFWCWPWIQSRR